MAKIKTSARDLAQSILTICTECNIEPMEATMLLLVYERMIPQLIQFVAYSLGGDSNSYRYKNIGGEIKKVPTSVRMVKENMEVLAIEGWIHPDPPYDNEFRMFDFSLTDKAIEKLDSLFEVKTPSYGVEFWNNYPDSVRSKGDVYVLTATDKTDFIQAYESEVDYDTHKKMVMPWLKHAIMKKEIKFKITTALANKPWEKYKITSNKISPKLS